MKRFFILFFVLFLFLNLNLVFAENINNNIYIPKIDINKEAIPLESCLKRTYSGYLYTITNNENVPIEIVRVNDYLSPQSSIDKIRKRRSLERFPNVWMLPVQLVGNTAFFIVCPLMYVIASTAFPCENPLRYKNPLAQTIEIPYRHLLMPIKNTALAPYYKIKDASDDKKAISESLKFQSNLNHIILKPNETIRLMLLDYMFINCKKEHSESVEFLIKNTITEQSNTMQR